MTTLNEVPLRQSRPPVLTPPEASPPRINVGPTERILTGIAGGLLMTPLFSRFTFPRVTLALLGGLALRRAITGNCPMYERLGINTARKGPARPEDYFTDSIHVEHTCIINRPPQELYQFWRNFENLPRFMRHLESVTVRDENHSHWVAKGPAGSTVEWDAEIINEEPNILVAWKSLQGADVDNAGSVRFLPAPGNRGTEVHVVLDYIPPAGRLGSAVAKLFGEEPRQQITEDLHRFKQLMEAGNEMRAGI